MFLYYNLISVPVRDVEYYVLKCQILFSFVFGGNKLIHTRKTVYVNVDLQI